MTQITGRKLSKKQSALLMEQFLKQGNDVFKPIGKKLLEQKYEFYVSVGEDVDLDEITDFTVCPTPLPLEGYFTIYEEYFKHLLELGSEYFITFSKLHGPETDPEWLKEKHIQCLKYKSNYYALTKTATAKHDDLDLFREVFFSPIVALDCSSSEFSIKDSITRGAIVNIMDDQAWLFIKPVSE